MILCIGLAADRTFAHTLRALWRARAAFAAVDLAHLALAGELWALPGSRELTIQLAGVEHALDRCRSVYARLFEIGTAAPSPALGARAAALSMALSEALAGGVRVVNPPHGGAYAFAKMAHGPEIARRFGWEIPRSCLTSSPREARAFLASCPNGAIFKGASAAKTWVTVYDPSRHAERLERLRAAPALFQELVAGADVRVHVVGDCVFAERISSPAVDYRRRVGNAYAPLDPPADVARAARALTAELATPFLALDFKLEHATGRWVFLELNTAPCYEGYDRRAGGAISRALVEWLMA